LSNPIVSSANASSIVENSSASKTLPPLRLAVIVVESFPSPVWKSFPLQVCFSNCSVFHCASALHLADVLPTNCPIDYRHGMECRVLK
jgi:hypothetical protein